MSSARLRHIRLDHPRWAPYLVRRSRWAGCIGVDLGRHRFLLNYGTRRAWA